MSTQLQTLPEVKFLAAGKSEPTSEPSFQLSEPAHTNPGQLRPFDILVIQSAIERYERDHPGCDTPTAEVALAWRLSSRSQRRKTRSEESVGEPRRSIFSCFRRLRVLF